MGMKPEPQREEPLDVSIQNFVSSILSEARNGVSNVLSNIETAKKPKVGEDTLEMNRVMVRQLVNRDDVNRLLNLKNKFWKAKPLNTVIVAVLALMGFVFASKSVFLLILMFCLSLFGLLIINLLAEQSLPKDIHNLLEKIAGSEDHLYVLEDMIKNTPYSTKSKIEAGWVLRELENFKNRDKEFMLKEGFKDNGNSMKTDLLRNINNE